jgi:hypothetical protein
MKESNQEDSKQHNLILKQQAVDQHNRRSQQFRFVLQSN